MHATKANRLAPDGINRDGISAEIAGLLLQAGSVTLNVRSPYRYASGLLSPIYCDNRLLLACPERRARVTEAFCERIRGLNFAPDLIAGVATAGIAWAAWVAERLSLPLAYVRAAAKDHGKGKRIEGFAGAGARAVVIEDLLSTGGSSAAAIAALRAAGIEAGVCMAIFSYQLPACRELFERIAVAAVPLTSFDALMDAAAGSGCLSPEELDVARRWNRDPHDWARRFGGGMPAPSGDSMGSRP